MAPRAVGALLALVAALLFTASLAGAVAPTAVPAWWDGHPRLRDKTFEHKAIRIGLLGAHGCNLGETTECESLETGTLPRSLAVAELAVLVLATLTTFALLVSIWRIGDRRKSLGRLAIIEAVIAAAIAGAWLALGPAVKAGSDAVAVPIGFGVYAFGGGVASVLLAGLLARKVEREPLRLKTSQASMPVPTPEQLAAFDVRELAQPRPNLSPIPPTPAYSALPPLPYAATLPSAYAAENASYTPPKLAPLGGVAPATGPHAPATGPHASAPGPHAAAMAPPATGPHAPVSQPGAPLFEHAPQLRPLYDMANVGVVPVPTPPKLPERPPTPIPRASLAETVEVPRSAPKPPTTPPPMGSPAKPTTPPPPMGSSAKPPTTPPPMGSPATPPPVAPPARTKAASIPPMRQVAPPSRATGERSRPTLAHAVPPMPGAAPRAETEADPSTTVEVDAEAKARWKAEQARKVAAVNAALSSSPVSVELPRDTDRRPVAMPDPTDKVPVRTVSPSAEMRAALADTHAAAPIVPELADTKIAPALELDAPSLKTEAMEAVTVPARVAPNDAASPHEAATVPARVAPSALVPAPAPAPSAPPPAATPAVTVDKADFDRTLERNPPPASRASAPSLKLPAIAVPKTIAPKPLPNVPAPAPAPAAPPRAEVKPEPEAKSAAVPLSTAPASLPPPKTAVVAPGPTPACPQCEAPMAWVEEHLRFYCKQCRMYF